MTKVLITGGTGLVGKQLAEQLLKAGYGVNILSRKAAGRSKKTFSFHWNIETGEIDSNAFEGISAIIHLAGTGIAEKRWTLERKRQIVESRVRSADLIFNFLKTHKHSVKAFISASAVGYYGNCGNEIVDEQHLPGKDFLAEVCKQWEESAKKFSAIGIREVRCRVGIVLTKNGGALPKFTRTIPFGITSYIAQKNLYYPWIHIDDLCRMFQYAIEKETLHGAVNATAPNPVLMKTLMKEITYAQNSKVVLIPVPVIGIKLAIGEMSSLLLSSQRCTSPKIIQSGFRYKFETVDKALANIYKCSS